MWPGQIAACLEINEHLLPEGSLSREALRVMEDYARFCLNHEGLSAELKRLRHELTQVLKNYLSEAILHRDVAGDVGVEIKTEAEGKRSNLKDVVVAAGKRLGEALRVIEEVLKTADASVGRATGWIGRANMGS